MFKNNKSILLNNNVAYFYLVQYVSHFFLLVTYAFSRRFSADRNVKQSTNVYHILKKYYTGLF